MLTYETSENPSRGIFAVDSSGTRTELVRVSCSIRPGTGVYLNIDVMDAEKTTANSAEVQTQLTAFVAEAYQRAASMGLPVPSIAASAGGGDA